MNLQAEMLFNRQQSQHMNLKIELNALRSQLSLQQPTST
jgi:hypothetical protein